MSSKPIQSDGDWTRAAEQLSLVLSFFPRVEGMLAVALGVNLGMLGVLAAKAEALRKFSPWHFVVAVPVLLICASLWCLYLAAFPRLDGGAESLIYFGEIAKKTEANFVHQFSARSLREHERDLLGQVWRNSAILADKYKHLKRALILLGLAALPWAISLTWLGIASQKLS